MHDYFWRNVFLSSSIISNPLILIKAMKTTFLFFDIVQDIIQNRDTKSNTSSSVKKTDNKLYKISVNDICRSEETMFIHEKYSNPTIVNILFDVAKIFKIAEICESSTQKRWLLLPTLLIESRKTDRTDILTFVDVSNQQYVCFFSDLENRILTEKIIYHIDYVGFSLCYVNSSSKPLLSPQKKTEKNCSIVEKNLFDLKPGDKISFEKDSNSWNGTVINASVKSFKDETFPPFLMNSNFESLSNVIILVKLTKSRKKNGNVIDLTTSDDNKKKVNNKRKYSLNNLNPNNDNYMYLFQHHVHNITKIDSTKLMSYFIMDHYVFKTDTIMVLIIPEFPFGKITQTCDKSVKVYFPKFKSSVWIDVVKFRNWKIFESEQSALSWIRSRLESVKLLSNARPGDFVLAYPKNFSLLNFEHVTQVPTYQLIQQITNISQSVKKISAGSISDYANQNQLIINFLDEEEHISFHNQEIIRVPEYSKIISNLNFHLADSDSIVNQSDIISVIFSGDQTLVKGNNQLSHCKLNSEIIFETNNSNLNNNSPSTYISKIKRITNEGILIGEKFFLPPYPSTIRCSKIY